MINTKICKCCNEEKLKTEFGKNKNYPEGLWLYCRICTRKKQKDSLDKPKNRQAINKRTSEYYQKNKKRRNEYQLKRHHERMKSDPLYVLKKRYRSRTRKLFRNKKSVKISSSMSFLGCTAEEFTKYFESKFTEGMTWDKVFSGDIHIDHIIPISSATTVEDLIKLSHFSNLQPLWAMDNLKKSNK